MSAHESDPEESVVHTRREGHTLFISMQRPAKRNAINRPMADGIDAALNEMDDDDSLWVGVLSGTDSIFSAGSDHYPSRVDCATSQGRAVAHARGSSQSQAGAADSCMPRHSACNSR